MKSLTVVGIPALPLSTVGLSLPNHISCFSLPATTVPALTVKVAAVLVAVVAMPVEAGKPTTQSNLAPSSACETINEVVAVVALRIFALFLRHW